MASLYKQAVYFELLKACRRRQRNSGKTHARQSQKCARVEQKRGVIVHQLPQHPPLMIVQMFAELKRYVLVVRW